MDVHLIQPQREVHVRPRGRGQTARSNVHHGSDSASGHSADTRDVVQGIVTDNSCRDQEPASADNEHKEKELNITIDGTGTFPGPSAPGLIQANAVEPTFVQKGACRQQCRALSAGAGADASTTYSSSATAVAIVFKV